MLDWKFGCHTIGRRIQRTDEQKSTHDRADVCQSLQYKQVSTSTSRTDCLAKTDLMSNRSSISNVLPDSSEMSCAFDASKSSNHEHDKGWKPHGNSRGGSRGSRSGNHQVVCKSRAAIWEDHFGSAWDFLSIVTDKLCANRKLTFGRMIVC